MIAGHLEYCDSPFWDRNLTLYSKYPDLTRCFQDSILFMMPSLYLLPTYPFYLWHLKKYGKTHIPYHISLLAILKIVLCVIITVLAMADIVLRSESSVRKPIVVSALLWPVLLFISYVLMAFLLYYERKKGIWSSGYTFNFWILSAIYLTIAIWSKAVAASKPSGHDPRSLYYLVVYSLQLALVILQVILHSLNSKSRSGFDSTRCHVIKSRFGSKGSVKIMQERGTVEESLTLNNLSLKEEKIKICPEVYASFLSRITFSWFDKLAYYGSKHPLVRGDLWNLSEKNTSHKLAPLFAHRWSKHMNKLREKRDAKSKPHHESSPEELLATLTPSESLLVDKLSNGPNTVNTTPKVIINTVAGRTAYTYDGSRAGPTQPGPKSSDKGLKPSLTYVLYSCFKSLIWQSVIYKFVNDMCTFLNPQLLHYIIAFIQAKQRQSIWVGIFYALAMLVSAIFHTFVLHQYFHAVFILGMRIKTILICAVYKKALRLSNSARRTSTVGEIVNLMSVDSQKITDVCSYISLLWSSPLQIFVCMVFLWSILGPSVLAGFLVMVLLIPLNGIIANKIKKLQTRQMQYKDERIKVMNEVLNGIKVLKLYAWEPSFEQKVLDIRNKEIDILKKIAFLNAVTSFVWSCAPFTVSCVTFGTYVLISPENILDASKAFVSLSLFNILRFPLSMLPIILTYVVEARVAMKRLCNFFMLDELDPDSVTKVPLDLNDKNVDVIVVENGNFNWDGAEPPDETGKSKKKRSSGRKRHLLHLRRRKKAGPEAPPLSRKNSCVAGKRGSKDDSFLPTGLPPLLTQSDKVRGSLPLLVTENGGKVGDKSPSKPDDDKDPNQNHLNGHLQLDTNNQDTIKSHESEDQLSDKEEPDYATPGEGVVNDGKKESYRTLTLHDINLSIKRGQLVAVVGTVGSGKSSLISALLGDMKRQGPETLTPHKGLDYGPSASPVNTSGYSSLNTHSHYPPCPKDAHSPDPGPDKEPLISAATIDDPFSPGMAPHPTNETGEVRGVSKVVVRGQVGYVSQQPWIRNATLKDNVVFDAPFGDDVIEYEKVLRACALTQDRDYLLPDGDDTEIGEKGVTLSGGQKQRLSLARAVYRRRLTDVYLLDDPLSAVDVHVGRHLFDNVLGPSGLLAQKTRVLVTNAIHILPNVDKIVVMKNGTIAEQGTYVELSSKMDGVFSELLKNYLASRLQSQATEDPTSSTTPDAVSHLDGKISQTSLIHATTPQRLSRANSKSKTSSSRSLNTGPVPIAGQVAGAPALKVATSHESLPFARKGSSPATTTVHPSTTNQAVITKIAEEDDTVAEQLGEVKNGDVGPIKVVDKDGAHLMTRETTETGRVRFSVYLTYFKAIKYHILIMFLLLYLFYYALSVAANFWLSDWSDDKPIIINGTEYQDIPLRNKRLQVYALYGGLQGAAIMASSIVIALSMVYASRTLHLKLLRNILHSPMVFFDTTPLGRIVNRFSKDMDTLDNSLPQNIKAWITTFYGVLSTILVISFSTPLFFVGILPMAIIYLFILKFYVPTSRQLKRLESVSRSPIFSHFQETLLGSSTIRAFGVADKFVSESHRLVDQNQMCYYPTIVSNRWLAVRLELIGSFIVFFSSLTVVLSRETIKPGLAGLAISYALSVTQALNWLVRMTCDLETNIVAVERVTEYSNTPVEAPWVIESRRPPGDWPTRGKVEFDHYWLRYRADLEPSLKDVTFSIEGEDKVGVVGRTGAGKSSLTAALFRIVEPETGSGHDSRIVIDGIDISTLGLHDLRSRLTIIPQDPVLFSGSLRFNLDPFNKYTEQEIWESLNKAHLKNFVSSLPQGINHEIAESGENLSLGQRQLVCLARAMLRNSKILVLDEATAAVDLETDELIQQTIREKFSPCTVITVAHRLNTVIDNTKILVLDHGRVAEYDTPLALLKNRKSKFYRMCHEAGLAFNTPTTNGSNPATTKD